MTDRFRRLFSIAALVLILAANTLAATADAAADEETNADLLIKRAQTAFATGHRDAAMALATKAIETDPKNSRGYFARARFHEAASEPAKALADYNQTLKLDPHNAEAWQQ